MPTSANNPIPVKDYPARPLNILLVDDHAVVRDGLRMLIDAQTDMTVIGEACDGEHVLRLAKELQPDLVIMDISMPGVNGVQATERLQAAYPHIKIIVLSSYSDEAHIRQALASGAASYVLKRTIAEELIRAIRTVATGGVYIDPAIAGMVANGYAKALPENKGAESLTKREHEVLLDVAYGYTNKEIADRLFMSVKTVEGHKARIREKLNLATRAEIVRYALHQGWLQDD